MKDQIKLDKRKKNNHYNHNEKPIRKCPKCGKEIEYINHYSLQIAIKRNKNCRSCSSLEANNRPEVKKKHEEFIKRYATKGKNIGSDNAFYGKKHTEEYKKNLSISRTGRIDTDDTKKKKSEAASGKNNSMYGKSVYNCWISKYGKEEANFRLEECKKKKSIASSGKNNPMYGKTAPMGSGYGWKGWYKGWFFRSIRELSYVIKVIEINGWKWESAENKKFVVKYIDYKGYERTYRADFFINDSILIEVKPKKLKSSVTVRAKQQAAEEFCKVNGWEYRIEDIDPLTSSEILVLYKNGLIVFADRYDKMFRNKYYE